MTNTDKPKFRHDCDRCTFLGTYKGFDLYHCEQKAFGPTIVIRYGNEGWEYSSGLSFAKRAEPGEPGHEAIQRAEKLNLNLKDL